MTAGYLTLLILGMGARLLPGFARQRARPLKRLLVVAIAANLAALFRVLPPLAVGLFAQTMWPLLSGRR